MRLTPLQQLVFDTLKQSTEVVDYDILTVLKIEPRRLSNRMNVVVKNIRKELKRDKSPYEIITIRGVGYQLIQKE